ncbi:MAG: gephyrin-like molybdotransferase Glp [Chitinophagaceae bacterium]
MISTSEAIAIIQNNVRALEPVAMSLEKAAGLTLAAGVFASLDIPAFPQSSMDGYAFTFTEWNYCRELVIEGEMAAGSKTLVELAPGKAIRIFTGAPVPAGADTVVMQEKVRTANGRLVIEDQNLKKGANVRPGGSEITMGALALSSGSRLSPAAIGFLAGIGSSEITVFPRPRVSIIVTGNELQQPGVSLEYGQVYESNSFALTAALAQLHICDVTVQQVPDDPDAVTNMLQQSLERSDVVLLSGGISAGDYDFVLQAATHCGVLQLFHKIRQRPGKPLYFGKKDAKLVFGLPGNPSSVLTCFYMYVVPALEKLCQQNFSLRKVKVPLGKTYQKASGLTHFLKGYFNGKTAAPLHAQESYKMHSFAEANCLIEIDESTTESIAGTEVNIYPLPI